MTRPEDRDRYPDDDDEREEPDDPDARADFRRNARETRESEMNDTSDWGF